MKMINLFEYQNKVKLPDSYEGLEAFLDDIWKNREKNSYFTEEQLDKIEVQQFVQILHKTNEIKSNKYVGVIHYNGIKINLLPKIFYDSRKEIQENDEKITSIHKHILWWLSYCRKIKFPNYKTSLGDVKNNDFFEVLIYLFSKNTRELLGSSIYQQYEDISNELSFIKGRLNINEYINENIAKARWHKVNCTYDSFEMDNKFNRIIKYVTTLLFNVTKNDESKKNLSEILFILDEVAEERASAEECKNIKFNPVFGEFETVRDYCYLFLNNSISFDYKNELKLFAFLLPMEYVFEDFIFGFIEKEVEVIKAYSQTKSLHLDVGKTFNLKPDLILEYDGRKIIADAKYKIVFTQEKDKKKGVSQNDLYQMVSYAIRFKINEILLFYPNTITSGEENSMEIKIIDEFSTEAQPIIVKLIQLPIINKEYLSDTIKNGNDLSFIFNKTRIDLIDKLKSVI